MKRESALLKVFTPIFALVCYFFLIYLAASAPAEALTYLMEAGIVVLLILFIRQFYLRRFPAAAQYSFRLPRPSALLGVLLLVPLWSVAKHRLIYALFSLGEHPEVRISAFYAEEPLSAGLISCISGVLLAPIIEELVFRYLPMAHCRKARNRILALVLYSLVFAVLHIRNFYGALLTALVCGTTFLLTKNITYSILLHGAGNLFVFLLGYLSAAGLVPLESMDYPVSILLFSPRALLLCLPAAVVGVVLLIRARRTEAREPAPHC